MMDGECYVEWKGDEIELCMVWMVIRNKGSPRCERSWRFEK